ncbi:MAG: NAD+ synthase [Thermoleophilaceae bacterium]|nr:NAD+ synthase [Thermoleophilaceae bacterium]
MKIALAQINPTVGDIEGNCGLIREWAEKAARANADVVLFPELVVTGYLPEDLLLRRTFLRAARDALDALAAELPLPAFVGFPECDAGAGAGSIGLGDGLEYRPEGIFNSLALLRGGKVEVVYRKRRLPNYGVFDERRYFDEGDAAVLVDLGGMRVALTVCEDLWGPHLEPGEDAALLVNPSASPYYVGKGAERERMFAERACEHDAAIAFCNLVGGQDELVFDGHSIVVSAAGEVLARGPQFEEALVVHDLGGGPGALAEPLSPEAEAYGALVLGLRDYVRKNGFERVVFGLSGGIDSALVALVAVDALGPENVTCVSMPSQFSSEGTRGDAARIAANLGVEYLELPIAGAMGQYEELLSESFDGLGPDVAEENLQARIRGNLLMALSNKFGWLVLTTGNKSEMSVGYATLYGDMAGGLAVIKDVFKGWVYRLVRWRNEEEGRELIPASAIERPPSAELRADQLDSDSLPDYDTLDAILRGYVEEDLSVPELVERGLDAGEVERVIRLVDRAEYKRRQAPPGIRVSAKAFGRDRRVPITNRWSG